MAFDKFWMIVEVSDVEDSPYGERVPKEKAPTFLHPSREQAETELLRLQQKGRLQGCEFVLMEAIAKAELRQVYVVEPIMQDQIPF
jgi:hypothetical protein